MNIHTINTIIVFPFYTLLFLTLFAKNENKKKEKIYLYISPARSVKMAFAYEAESFNPLCMFWGLA